MPPPVDEAITYNRVALALRPESPGVWLSLGVALCRKGEIEESLAAYQQAARLKPDYAWAHCDLGDCFNRMGRPDQAIAECQEALRLKPDFPCALINLAAALGEQGKPAEAITALEHAFRLDPDFAGTRNQLAWLLATCPDAKFRDAKRAVGLAQEAVQITPNADNLNTLGIAYYRAGKCRDAIQTLERATKLHSGDAYDWFFLAMAHGQVGEKARAKQFHQQAVQWMEKYRPKNPELLRFRAEAEELLELEK
jgi:superkiller protein 3